MFRKGLAALLISSWIILSVVDLVEDLELPDRTEFGDATDAPVPSNPFEGLLTRNIVESAAHEGIHCANLLGEFIVGITVHKPHLTQTISKLYKIFRVFII